MTSPTDKMTSMEPKVTYKGPWKVVYRGMSETLVARSGMTHREACEHADALNAEGWKHVNVVKDLKS